MTCRECAQLEWVALEYIGVWAGHPRWWEPNWRTRRRIDHAMKVREQMNKDYAAGMCLGLHGMHNLERLINTLTAAVEERKQP